MEMALIALLAHLYWDLDKEMTFDMISSDIFAFLGCDFEASFHSDSFFPTGMRSEVCVAVVLCSVMAISLWGTS